jgi:hypothetical protein
MTSCTTHEEHTHKHGPNCGHKTVKHDGHVDYLHDGHLHHMHDNHIDEHKISEAANKTACTPDHKCSDHATEHKHGHSCGHEAVPHGDHVDYLVSGHLHHPCTSHCDSHGAIDIT